MKILHPLYPTLLLFLAVKFFPEYLIRISSAKVHYFLLYLDKEEITNFAYSDSIEANEKKLQNYWKLWNELNSAEGGDK